MNTTLKTLFMGTPDSVLPSLELLYKKTQLKGIITAPDKTKGRHRKKQIAPLPKVFAMQHNIAFRQANQFENQSLEELCQFTKELQVDLIIVQAYGYILPEVFLKCATIDAINIHFSLLPKYRGATPIQSVLMDGLCETGITIQKISPSLDAGDILYQKKLPIHPNDTFIQLSHKLNLLAPVCLDALLKQYQTNQVCAYPQNHLEASYTSKIKKEDGKIHWNAPFKTIHQQIKAYQVWPKSYTFYKGKRFIIHRIERIKMDDEQKQPGSIICFQNNKIWIQCADAIIHLCQIQPENKGILSANEFVNGYTWQVDELLY